MSETDYYKILGVNKKSSDSDIKKAYRKLAMKYHPDHTEGNKAAEEKFKQISEAYAVLSDKEKRQQYDTFGSTGFHQRYSQEDIFKNFNFGDILKEFGFSGGGGGCKSGKRGGGFSFGGRSPFGAGAGSQAQVKGSDLIYELPLTLQEVAKGTSKTITYQNQGRNENITVKIPKGMINGKKLRLAGKGSPSPYGGPAGDLYIQAKIIADPVFNNKGNDLYQLREIRLTEAILGTTLAVPTIEGKSLNLKVPPGTKPKTKMRLGGHGLPQIKGNATGDLYVNIDIKIPKTLTPEQEDLIKKLADTGL